MIRIFNRFGVGALLITMMIAIAITLPGVYAKDYITSIFLTLNDGAPITTLQNIRLSLWSDPRLSSGDVDGAGDINVSAQNYSNYQVEVSFIPDSLGRLRIGLQSLPNFPQVTPENQFLMIEYKDDGDPNTAYVIYDDDYIDGTELDRFPLVQNGPDIYKSIVTNFGTTADSFVIDENDSAVSGTLDITFGTTLNEVLQFNIDTDTFFLSDDLAIAGDLNIQDDTITLDSDNLGSGANVSIVAEQGTDSNGEIRYNATSNVWELNNDGGAFDTIATFSSISLDDAYNNFFTDPSTIVVDAAEGQTGGITFGGVLGGDETVTITNSANGGVLLLENAGTGDSFRVNDEVSDTTPFVIDDVGAVTLGDELTLSAFGTGRSTIITDPADVPADIDGYLIVNSSGGVEQLQSNEGVVKVNGDVNGKPIFSATAGVEYQITYASPLTISTATDWPETAPADEDSFYDFATDKFLENPVQFQNHLFRLIVNYSGFTTGGTDKVIVRLYNPISGFELTESADVPKGFTFGTALFDLWVIADSASIGNGYELYLSATDDSSLEVDSVTRFSFHKD